MDDVPATDPATTPRQHRLTMAEGYGLGQSAWDPERFGWPLVRASLEQARNYWIVTSSRAGRPHAVPVWGLWYGTVLAFSTDPDSVKARNFASRADVVVHLESGDDVVILEGTVEPMDHGLVVRFCDDYLPKYGLRPDPSNPGHGFYVFRPRSGRTWLESAFPETASRWQFHHRDRSR